MVMADLYCPICRDTQPAGCPGCDAPKVPVMNVKTWIDRLNTKTPRMDADVCHLHAMAGDVHKEIFRSIGEPWHGTTSEYPDKYGYYPGCNEG